MSDPFVMLNSADEDAREFALDVAVSLLYDLGYRDPDEPDKAGQPVGDVAQSMLAELMFRVPELGSVMAPAINPRTRDEVL